MDWPMMEWVFDHRYLDLGHAGPPVEYLVQAHDAREADLLELMGQLVERYPEVRIASLPHCSADPRDLEFGVRGREAGARRGLRWLTGELDLRGYRWEARRQPAG
jgi:molybdopterin-biosynthesis enzyme MoeA-like protein